MKPIACAAAVALLGFLLVANANAEFSGTAALVTDYRFRGISLSDEKPAAQMAFAYDDPQGWYSGALLSSVQFLDQSRRALIVPYLGYVQVHSGFNWEIGGDYYNFIADHGRDYPEVYFGITSTQGNARLYYAQNYFGQYADVFYLEINAARPVGNSVTVLFHVGALRRPSGRDYDKWSRPYRYDFRVGVGKDTRHVSLQLAWVGSTRDSSSPTARYQTSNALVLSLSRMF